MPKRATLILTVLTVLLAVPARAHHRQTPAVVQFTTSGDNALPRVTTFAAAFALVLPATAGEGPIVGFDYPYPSMQPVAPGSDANPTVSSGRVVAWDAGASGNRQIFMRSRNLPTVQVTTDPTGTSSNPATNGNGQRIAFESNGNLAVSGNEDGARQIFLWSRFGITQISRGMGTSTNPSLSRNGLRLAFQSTSDPVTGADTNVSQVWLANARQGTADQLTSAPAAPSSNPAMAADGRVLGFESRADLVGDGHDTGKSQIFIYEVVSGNFARITNDTTTGCSGVSVHKFRADWRIAFVCGGQGYYYLLRAGQRFQVPLESGANITHMLAELNPQFLLVSTTADLLNGGLTANHQVYLINLFKRPAVAVAGTAVWFPHQGRH